METMQGGEIGKETKGRVAARGQGAMEAAAGTGRVKFWSMQSGYTVAVSPGENARFVNHVLELAADDPIVRKIRELRTPDVREIVNRPFADEGSLAKFNSFLSEIVFTGERGEPSKRGVVAVLAMFEPEECNDLEVGTRLVADQLIVRALKSKSFKEGI